MKLFRWMCVATGYMAATVSMAGTATAQTLRCNVADISKYGSYVRSAEEDAATSFYSVALSADTTMTDYMRAPGGQWPLDLKSRTASAVDLVLDTATGPYRIHLDISVNGQPFRTHQEQGIAKAIELAKTTKPASADSAVTSITEDENETPKDDGEVSALTYQRSDVVSKLAGYLRTQGSETVADAEELQWMVSQWLPGGRLLVATPNFGLRYVHAIALCRLIAGDDLEISAAEIEAASERVRAADTDENSIVSTAELIAATRSSDATVLWPTKTLLRTEDDSTLHTADQQVKIDLAKGGQCCVTRDDQSSYDSDEIKADLLGLETSYGKLTILSVMDQRTTGSFFGSGQVSVGAMLMPEPLLRYVDSRPDGQLDMREIAQLPERLRSLDRNSDDKITSDEIPMEILLVVSQGPWANRLLTEQSQLVLPKVLVPSVKTPPWFVGMDSNNDGLLSRREFLGDDAQFAESDDDGDGVISAEEVTEDQ